MYYLFLIFVDLKLYKLLIRLVMSNYFKMIFTESPCFVNCMVLNTNKCSHIKYTRQRRPLVVTYLIDRAPSTNVYSTRDLGVTDATLSFPNHVDSIISKASRPAVFSQNQCTFLIIQQYLF